MLRQSLSQVPLLFSDIFKSNLAILCVLIERNGVRITGRLCSCIPTYILQTYKLIRKQKNKYFFGVFLITTAAIIGSAKIDGLVKLELSVFI